MAKIAEDTSIINEVFSGIQGEGVLVGFRQIFVRFHGCNLACAFCDTPASRATPPAQCLLETKAGARTMDSLANPVSVSQLQRAVRRLQERYPHHSISLTGGEPLLQRAFLDELLPKLHGEGFRTYLETNGVLADEMTALSVPPHYVAMDMKLPSMAGIAPQWEQHAAFLDIVACRLSRADSGYALPDRLQVKLVFGEGSLAEVEHATEIIARCRPYIPCVLQPVTAGRRGPVSPNESTILEAQRIASRLLTDVRVIPQTHVMLGLW